MLASVALLQHWQAALSPEDARVDAVVGLSEGKDDAVLDVGAVAVRFRGELEAEVAADFWSSGFAGVSANSLCQPLQAPCTVSLVATSGKVQSAVLHCTLGEACHLSLGSSSFGLQGLREPLRSVQVLQSGAILAVSRDALDIGAYDTSTGQRQDCVDATSSCFELRDVGLQGLDALALTPGQRVLVAAAGPRSMGQGRRTPGICRLLHFSGQDGHLGGSPTRELYYEMEVSAEASGDAPWRLAALAALDDLGLLGGRLLAAEYQPEARALRVFLLSTVGATDVSECCRLNAGQERPCDGLGRLSRPVSKQLLLEWTQERGLLSESGSVVGAAAIPGVFQGMAVLGLRPSASGTPLADVGLVLVFSGSEGLRFVVLQLAAHRSDRNIAEVGPLPAWSHVGGWSEVDGGHNRACGGLPEGSTNVTLFTSVPSLEACRNLCESPWSTRRDIQLRLEEPAEPKPLALEGLNCYPGAGATAVPGKDLFSGSISLILCKEACQNDFECTAVTVIHGKDPTPCWFRKDVVPEKCIPYTSYDTYIIDQFHPSTSTTRPSGGGDSDYTRESGRNCYPGHGAEPVGGTDYLGDMGLEECRGWCSATASCEAVTVIRGTDPGPCWVRANVVIKSCIPNTNFDTWLRSSSTTTVVPPSPQPPAPTEAWRLCSAPGHCSGYSLLRWATPGPQLAGLVGSLASLPGVDASAYKPVAEHWQSFPPTFDGAQVTLDDIATFMRELLNDDPFGTGGGTVPWMDFGDDGTTVAITQRQLAFIVTQSLMGNTLVGASDGLSASLRRCSAKGPSHNTFVYSLLSFLAVLSRELRADHDGTLLVATRPRAQDDSWRGKLDKALTDVVLCNLEGSPFNLHSTNKCGVQEFMGGSPGGQQPEEQALTDIAGAVVGGGAELCELAASQDESLVQFYPETLAMVFFRPAGSMLPSPFSFLGVRRYLSDLSGETTADPPLRNLCGSVASKDWLNNAIIKSRTLVSLTLAGTPWSAEIAPSSFVAVASSAWWIQEPNGCKHEDALENNCEAQRRYYDQDISQWYQAFEPTMYDEGVQDVFRRLVRTIGTGPWGAGVWWGDSQMYFLKVWLATSLVGSTLNYYTYDHFVENAGNQCFVLGGPEACKTCLQDGAMSWQISPERCGKLGGQDMKDLFRGSSARTLYTALAKVGPPPAQVFDSLSTVLRAAPSPPAPVPSLRSRRLSPVWTAPLPYSIATGGSSCSGQGMMPIVHAGACADASRLLQVDAAVGGVAQGPDRCQVIGSHSSAVVCTADPLVPWATRFERVTGRPCASANMLSVQTEDVCRKAAAHLGIAGNRIAIESHIPGGSLVCYYGLDTRQLVLGPEPSPESVRLCLNPAKSAPSAGTVRCKGIEYNAAAGRCSVWHSGMHGSSFSPDSVCLKREEQ